MNKTIKDILQYIVIYILVIGMICVIIMVFKVKVPEENKTISDILIGVFSAKFADAVAYLLNSSKGSAEKSETIAKLPALPNDDLNKFNK